MRTRPVLSWLTPLLLAACGGDAASGRPCDRLGLLCSDDQTLHNLGLDDSRSVSADLDRDGELDLVTAGGSAGLSIAWSTTDLRDYRLFPGPVPAPEILSLDHADMDNDGVPELIVGGLQGVLSYSLAGRVVAPPITHIRSEPIQGLLIADLEADGHADILRTDDNLLNVTLRNATGDEHVQLPFDPPWQQLRAADLDSDGILDLLGLQDGKLVTRLSAPQPVETP